MGEAVKMAGGDEVAFGITVSEDSRGIMYTSLLNDKLVAFVAPGHRRIGQYVASAARRSVDLEACFPRSARSVGYPKLAAARNPRRNLTSPRMG